MSIRIWASPWVGTGAALDPYRAKAEQYCRGFVNFFPSNPDGTPAHTWVVTIGRSADWTAASADVELTDIFAGDLPATIDTPADLRTFLRTRTIGDVPLARRQQIQANLDTLGVVRSDFTLTTPLWRVFRRIASTLFEKDDGFASAFNF